MATRATRRSKSSVRVESIAFRLAPSTTTKVTACRLVADVLGPRKWSVSALSIPKGEFEAVPPCKCGTAPHS
jgi:hypothetical protein